MTILKSDFGYKNSTLKEFRNIKHFLAKIFQKKILLFESLPNGDEVLERLAHFHALNAQRAAVQEVVHPVRVVVVRFALKNYKIQFNFTYSK